MDSSCFADECYAAVKHIPLIPSRQGWKKPADSEEPTVYSEEVGEVRKKCLSD
jgi:hypothetical protein